MEPKDFIRTAEYLISFDPHDPDTQPIEADIRTAVGRAYYASFLDARELLEAMSFVNLQKGNTHHNVQKYLRNGGSEARKISEQLSGMHTRRKNADYDITTIPSFVVNDAQRAINKAEKILIWIDSCHRNPKKKEALRKSIESAIPNP